MSDGKLRGFFQTIAKPLGLFLKWLIISLLIGLIVGGCSSLFAICLRWVTGYRESHRWVVFFLPVAGMLIVLLYQKLAGGRDRGTNLVIANIHAKEEVPWIMAPLIFVATVLTHLCGGSAGREGAALQLGGSMGQSLGSLLRLDENDRRVTVMCGMSAAFAAVFGTPMAAALFAMEVASVGVLYYAALMPCVFSALVATRFAAELDVYPDEFLIHEIPEFVFGSAAQTVLVAAACAGVSILMCLALHRGGALCRKAVKNPYVRAAGAGCVIIATMLICGNQDYLGAGVGLIQQAITGQAAWYSFLLKMALTAITIGCGFKGGEIVPSFCVGATFGCVAGQLLGFSPSLCAACGMVALFCGVTNCPIASLLIAFELFGYEAMPYFLITVSVSFVLSGYYGLYREQTIVYSKYKTKYVNRKIVE